jgi:uncharacterized integral membrane protein
LLRKGISTVNAPRYFFKNAVRQILKWLRWAIRAAVFLVLLVFALNNQQVATLNLMFGREWRSPMTLIVLAAFAAGMIVGVLGMLPSWWKYRSKSTALAKQPAPATVVPATARIAPPALTKTPEPIAPTPAAASPTDSRGIDLA